MQLERRDYYLTPELRLDDDHTRVVGYAAVFNEVSQDLGGFKERIAPGAFKRVLGTETNVVALFNHDMNNLLASRAAGTLRLAEDDKGLRYEFDLDESDPDHQRIIAKVKRGDLRGSSFAFRTNPKKDIWEADESDYPLRTVTEVSALRDVGPVTTPAYLQTEGAGAALALRSLAEQIDTDVADLVKAGTELRDFLLRQDNKDDDSADAAASPDAAADERVTPAPLPKTPKWYEQYQR